MNSATRTLSKTILQPLQYLLDAAFFVIGIAFLLRFGQDVFPLAKFDPINILPKIKIWCEPVLKLLGASSSMTGGRSAQILPLGVSVISFVLRYVVVGQIRKMRNSMEEQQAETLFEAKRTPSGKISQGIEMADSEESREKLLRDLRDIEKKLKWSVKKRCTFLSIDVVGSTAMKQGKSQTDIAASFQAYEETLRKIFDKFGVWKQAWTPDGVMTCFLQRDLAVAAGIRVLQTLKKFNETDNRLGVPFTVRCGINEGEVAIYDDSKLEKVADHVIDVAGHMQKHCEVNCLWLSDEVYNNLVDKQGWRSTDHVVDGCKVYEWALDPSQTVSITSATMKQAAEAAVSAAASAGNAPAAANAPAAPAASGARMIGRYEILGEIGRGAMGAVFRARDPQIGRTVAIKVILTRDLAPDELQMYKARFYREAQAAGKMHHPGIITVHDLGDDATGAPFLVMENVEGRTLDIVGGHNAEERLPVEKALDIGIQLAEALDYAHSQGVIHRDIKPSNIMITADGQAKIGDFGIAKLDGTHLTMAGQVLGTPSYMSPEQLTGAKLDGRSDLFSLGVVMYWLLTGEKPFAADTVTAITYKVVHADPLPARQLNPALSADVEKVLQKCLAKLPENRYANGKALAADLRAVRNGQPISA